MIGRPYTYRGRRGLLVRFGRRGRMSQVCCTHGYEVLTIRQAKRLGDHHAALLTLLWASPERIARALEARRRSRESSAGFEGLNGY